MGFYGFFGPKTISNILVFSKYTDKNNAWGARGLVAQVVSLSDPKRGRPVCPALVKGMKFESLHLCLNLICGFSLRSQPGFT